MTGARPRRKPERWACQPSSFSTPGRTDTPEKTPCVVALREAAALPAAVFGPLEPPNALSEVLVTTAAGAESEGCDRSEGRDKAWFLLRDGLPAPDQYRT